MNIRILLNNASSLASTNTGVFSRLGLGGLAHCIFGLAGLVGFASITAADGPAGGFGEGGGAAVYSAAANEVTEFKGTLKDARGNLITVTREDGTDCLVMFPDEITGMNFVANALPAYLRRGMPIRFATVLGPTGMPLRPIDKIEVYSPLPPKAVPHSQMSRFTPGVQSAERKKPVRGAPLSGKVDVVGNLMMLTPQGGLAVQAGATPVQTMVSPDAKIEIRLNNLTLAQPGDAVSVSGFYQPPDDTKVKASRITITTDRVYGEEQPKPVRAQRGKRATAAEKKPDEAPAAIEAAEAGNAKEPGLAPNL